MRPTAGGPQLDAHGAVAAALDDAVRGFAEDREIRREQVGVRARETAETVEGRLHLLVVVPDPRDVVHGLGELDREGEGDRDAALHVDRAAPPQGAGELVALEPCRQVVVDGHGVDVAGDDDPLRAPELRAGDDRVAVARDLEVGRLGSQRRLEGVGEHPFIAGDAGQVAQGAGEADDAGAHGKGGGHVAQPSSAPR